MIQQKCDNNIDFYVTNSMTRLLLAFLLYIIEVKMKLTRPLKAWSRTQFLESYIKYPRSNLLIYMDFLFPIFVNLISK